MRKLSLQMIRMLLDVETGFGTHSTAMARGEHAGRYKTARALRKHGLLDYGNELTDAGRAALTAAEIERNREGA